MRIRFEPGSNEEFVGSDCVDKYNAAVQRELSAYFGENVELSDDSPFGTKVEGDFDSSQAEQEASDAVYHILNGIGNRLSEICS